MQTASPAPLISDIPIETLRRNVASVLDTLAQNRYQDHPPAKLIAVTKTVDANVINHLKPLGILDIGENRTQVATAKLPKIAPEFQLHWIGRLQTNKVKYIIEDVCLLQTLDRMELAQEVNRRAAQHGRVLSVLLQVNIAGETQKGGMPPDEVEAFLRQIKGFSSIHVEGLMSIMPLQATPSELRGFFRGMRALFDRLRDTAVDGVDMRELSMGMSNDYAIAAQEGATMVRIGTALYRRG